jgi:putative spermidine/putrescine transport system ATP-binding protein
MAFLELKNVQKTYGQTQVVKDFNMDIEKGEFISFLGPSGCGKTTTLRMVAGFETPSAGDIVINGVRQNDLKTNQRNIGMVFQAYALFPNMTVADNVGFGLRVKGMEKETAARTISEMLALVSLTHLADRYPFQLSGGQQQRVALARALAIKPQVLLLDEPLSALDAKIRVSLREEIRAIQQKMGITTIFVTHDQEEALSISDRVVVMYQGHADQIGTPFEIYNRPKTKFVATFVGTLSILEATVADPAANTVTIGGTTVKLVEPLGSVKAGDKINLALRPEALSLSGSSHRDFMLTGKVEAVSFLGSVIRTKLNVDGQSISFDMFNDPQAKPPVVGDTIEARFSANDLLIVRD